MAEAKNRGVELGRNGKVLAQRNREAALAYALTLESFVRPLIDEKMSYSSIAKHLNNANVQTRKGGKFFPETAKHLVQRLRRGTHG